MEFPSACPDGLGSSFFCVWAPISIRLSRRPGQGGRAAVVECAGSGEMAPWAAAGPGARRHIRARRTRASALRRRSRNSGLLQPLLWARARFCPPTRRASRGPLASPLLRRESPSPKQLFPPRRWREKNKSAAAARSRRRNTSSSAWRRIGRAENGRRSSLRCGRSDDVRAAPASISVCPSSSALLFGLRRGVAVVTRRAYGAV